MAVVIELDEAVVLVGGFLSSDSRIGDVLHEKLAVGLEERQHFGGQRVHGFVGDQAIRALPPAERRRRAARKKSNSASRSDSAKRRTRFNEPLPSALAAASICVAELAVLAAVEVVDAQGRSEARRRSEASFRPSGWPSARSRRSPRRWE